MRGSSGYASFALMHSLLARKRWSLLNRSAHLTEPPLRTRAQHLVTPVPIGAGRLIELGTSEMQRELVWIRLWVWV